MQPHKRWWKESVGYDAPLIRYSSLLGRNQILILDPEIIKDILTAPASKSTARFIRPQFFLPDIIGNGLVTLEGEEWMKHRRIIQPSFSISFLKEALDGSVPPRVGKFIQLWKEAGEKREIDLASHLSALTLDIIGDVAFSHDFGGVQDVEKWASSDSDKPELSDPLISSMIELLKPSIVRVMFFVLGLSSLDRKLNPTTRRAISEINKTIDKIMHHAKEKLSSANGPSKTSKSVLQLLFDAAASESSGGEPNLNDAELRDELKTFLLAGHETTSTWCYWALYALSKWPDVQEKLYQEVSQVASDMKGSISLEHIEKMDYLDAFLNETLRFFPPVGLTSRVNQYEETIAKYKIPPGTNLIIPIHLMHRHPKYWDNPDDFWPERWLKDEKLASSGLDTRGFKFLPFGAGGHACIGYRFAQIEAKLIIAEIVRSLRVEIAPSQRDVVHTFTTIVTMKAKPPLKIVARSR